MPKMSPQKIAKLKKAMIAALNASMGIVTTSIAQVKISRDLHERWVREDADYAQAAADVLFISIEFAMSKLYQRIADGDIVAIKYYLDAKGAPFGFHHPRSAHWLKQAAEAGLQPEDDKNITITVKYA